MRGGIIPSRVRQKCLVPGDPSFLRAGVRRAGPFLRCMPPWSKAIRQHILLLLVLRLWKALISNENGVTQLSVAFAPRDNMYTRFK